jgi:phage terminase large subunit-like protein
MDITYEKKSVEDWIKEVDYSNDANYMPSEFALKFVNFIKLVNAEAGGEEHKTPVIHLKMLDGIATDADRVANMLFRGAAKTTLIGEYLFLYLAVFEELPGLGQVSLAMYVSDSIENGVKNMRKNLEHRWNNSDFLQKYLPQKRLTDVRWEFTNASGHTLVVKGYGATTGIRGVKEMGLRPTLAVLDDLISDEDARSATVISSIEDTVYKAVNYALHPSGNKIIWNGTPFNARDPLYKAIGSGAWLSSVYPVCAAFPCDREDFRGAWGDRFNYDYVDSQYKTSLALGKVDGFDQEMMLRIMSDADRLIPDDCINWYQRSTLLRNKHFFNFYITTDFATSSKAASDYSFLSVWAYNSNGDWFWVDGFCEKQDMGLNVDGLFRMVNTWKPKSVGIEVSGQQGGYIPWLKNEMITRNIYFDIAKEKPTSGGLAEEGFRPSTNKIERFIVAVPLFKQGHIKFPIEMKESKPMIEMVDELSLVAPSGFRSLHDDAADTVSMLPRMQADKPSAYAGEDLDEKKNDAVVTTYAGVSLWDTDALDMDYSPSGYDDYV